MPSQLYIYVTLNDKNVFTDFKPTERIQHTNCQCSKLSMGWFILNKLSFVGKKVLIFFCNLFYLLEWEKQTFSAFEEIDSWEGNFEWTPRKVWGKMLFDEKKSYFLWSKTRKSVTEFSNPFWSLENSIGSTCEIFQTFSSLNKIVFHLIHFFYF